MKPEDKQLLFQDLCARLPYGVKAQVYGWDEEKGEVEVPLKIYSINTDGYVYFETNDYDVNYLPVEDVRPFLRPMSSMTEEEKKEYNIFFEEYAPDDRWPYITKNFVEEDLVSELIDWLNKKMFDLRGLIPKSLALSTETYNPYIINI